MEDALAVEQAQTATNHFGHRETDGIVVDLFWNRGDLEDEFRVEVEDRRDGTRFVLYPTSGRDAVRAFYHPFAGADPHRLVVASRRKENRHDHRSS